MTAVALTAAVIVIVAALSGKHIIPPAQQWLIPKTVSGKWIFALILNVIAAGVSVLFCEIAVKKSADCEL